MDKQIKLFLYHSILTSNEIDKLKAYIDMDVKVSQDVEPEVHNIGTWNYEVTHLQDQFYLPVFKISRRLSKISGHQVISRDLIKREYEIPFSYDNEPELDEASGALVVNICFKSIFLKNL